MKVVGAAILCLLLAGCVQPPGPPEDSGVGWVRSVNVGFRTEVVFESEDHKVKSFDFCARQIVPVWKGERVDFIFYWDSAPECYELVSSKHLPPDAK